MNQPSSTEAHLADLNRTKVHPDVAIHTHLCFMSMMRDWIDEMDPFVNWWDYSRQDLLDIMEGLMDMYEEKL
ncbi:MAG: hypothetical protein Unbinned4409contig1001_63 [Prokaryotic dsDNA virus sp.]|nr:MAG: hypothetical protein Unbinned4409contig1001_63 [Prokaryotic dsDNA virus sp.]|tara:strand:+ start:4460 stop:4675 length:216 start_codon:yes stop_codon:yes gene_type:complete